MRIPLIVLPGYRKYLHLEKRYGSRLRIVPVGCDCHPAYVLAKLNIRRYSLPFDWLNMEPVSALWYVNENFDDGFSRFMSDLTRSDQGHVISKHFPLVEFLHDGNLIESVLDQKKLRRRIDRLTGLMKTRKCAFLHNISSISLTSSEAVQRVVSEVIRLLAAIKTEDELHIYIRYDEVRSENEAYCSELFHRLSGLDRVHAAHYIRHKASKGIWGDPAAYLGLLQDLGLTVSMRFPKIRLK